MGNRRVVAAAASLAAALFLAIQAATGSGVARAADAPMAADDLTARIAAGESVVLDGAVIVGNLILDLPDPVARAFRCTNCQFQGSIVAPDSVFARVVDLTGSTVNGDLDLRGSTFHGTFQMGGPARIGGDANLALAVFHGRASLAGTTIDGAFEAGAAQFLADASFAETSFGGPARFDAAIFSGRTLFSGASGGTASFADVASFAGTVFETKVDFRQRQFLAGADFTGASFDVADFGLVEFDDAVTFDDTSFDDVASFRGATYYGDLSFRYVLLRGPTDFDAAVFGGRAEFFRTTATDGLTMREVIATQPLGLDQVSAVGFAMDRDQVDRIESSAVRQRVLAMVEAGARAAGNLDLANESAFAQAQLETDRAKDWARVAGMLNEQIAGYLLIPWYPLRAMLPLLLIGIAVRAASRLVPALAVHRPAWELAAAEPKEAKRGAARAKSTPRRRAVVGAGYVVGALLSSVIDAIRAAVRIKPRDVPEERREDPEAVAAAVVGFIEWAAYKVLIALVLVGLASSYPTFRQLVEALT